MVDNESSIRRAFAADRAPEVDLDRAWESVRVRLEDAPARSRRSLTRGPLALVASVAAVSAIVLGGGLLTRDRPRLNATAPSPSPSSTATAGAALPALALRNWTYRGPVQVGAAGDIDKQAGREWAAKHAAPSASDVHVLPLLGVRLSSGSNLLLFQCWLSGRSEVYLAAYLRPVGSPGRLLSDVHVSRTPAQISGVVNDGSARYVVALGPPGSEVIYADQGAQYRADQNATGASYGVFPSALTEPTGTLVVSRDHVALYGGPVGSLTANKGGTIVGGELSLELPVGWYEQPKDLNPGAPTSAGGPFLEVADFPLLPWGGPELPNGIEDPILALAGREGILISVEVTAGPAEPSSTGIQLTNADWVGLTEKGVLAGHSIARHAFAVGASQPILVSVEIGQPPNAAALAAANAVLPGLRVAGVTPGTATSASPADLTSTAATSSDTATCDAAAAAGAASWVGAKSVDFKSAPGTIATVERQYESTAAVLNRWSPTGQEELNQNWPKLAPTTVVTACWMRGTFTVAPPREGGFINALVEVSGGVAKLVVAGTKDNPLPVVEPPHS